MGTKDRSPKYSPLKRLNEHLRAHDLSFSDALNVALFLLTGLSLVLAGIGVYLASVTINDARKAGDHQDTQFNLQMGQLGSQLGQLKSSASDLGKARDLLNKQGEILKGLQTNTAKRLEEERTLLSKLQTNSSQQLQIAEKIYAAHPVPAFDLDCEVNGDSTVVEGVRKSNDKVDDVTVQIRPLHDYDRLTNVGCCWVSIRNEGNPVAPECEIIGEDVTHRLSLWL